MTEDYALGTTIYLHFTTRRFSTGVPFTLAGTPVISVLEENNATPITAGITLSVDRATVTGLNEVAIVATSGNGYESGKAYAAYISTGTVDSVSVVGEVIGRFTIEKQSALRPTTAGRTLDVTATGAAGVDWGNVENPTTANALSGTTVGLTSSATSAQLVDDVWDEVLSGATHNVVNSAGRRLRQIQEAGGYSGYIWIDTIGGTAGTTAFENGTDTNPVNSLADANTLATALTISQFKMAAGSSITFAATQATQVFDGENWTVALGGQNISSTHIRGATVSGICTGTGTPEFHECHVGNVTVPASHFTQCHLEGTVTLPAGAVHIEHCSGNGSTVFEFGALVGNTTVNVSDFSGEVTINNLGATGTDVLNIRGHGKIIFAASCVGGTVNWDGHFEIVNNGSGITFAGDDIYNNTVNIYNRIGAPAGASIAADIDAIPTAVENADTLLDRNMATGADSGSPTVRTVRQALRALRNKWTNSAGTYTVYKEDDTTSSWTSTVSTDAAADPITGSDPA